MVAATAPAATGMGAAVATEAGTVDTAIGVADGVETGAAATTVAIMAAGTIMVVDNANSAG
jgi:hypothetical protein